MPIDVVYMLLAILEQKHLDMQNTEMKKYLQSDETLNKINSMFISLQIDEVKKVNEQLLPIIEMLINHMKSEDSLFEKMYKEIIFCGSFYKNTKIEAPNEFDLNITLKLPINYNYINCSSDRAGFVKISIEDNVQACATYTYKNLTNKEIRQLNKLISNNFVNPNTFRFWIKGIIDRVMNKLQNVGNRYRLLTNNLYKAYIKKSESGPAITLIVNIPYKTEDIHVDLAPSLPFDIYVIQRYIPEFDKLETCRYKNWFAIPVPVRTDCNNSDSSLASLYWRTAFSLQENEVLAKCGRVKQVIRLLKKLRNTQNLKSIASYYIETTCLNKLTEIDININRISVTYLFFEMLKELQRVCEQRKLDYYWNKEYNLLSRIGEMEMYNIAQRLKNIIKDIEKNATDKYILAKYIRKLCCLKCVTLY
ncbi:cyclic GMP-AMP synthase-like receptor isoform X1 [Bombus pascuorum]|uniref:cyclic GMP-AMP synthase-like receptor isoform X1 n=2 Tax=Bombus pascuorum TaxID=65598 RepID=UPI00298DC1B1|nr:cyclic GMP-AMP synthase-like receptor isoform X1 [Bombus pascuorum]